MSKCYNITIMYLMQLLHWFCQNHMGVKKIKAYEFNQLPFDAKKEYLKTAFEVQVCKMYDFLKKEIHLIEYGLTWSYGPEEEEALQRERERLKMYKKVYEIAESVKLAVDKLNNVPGGKTVRFQCFLHDDSTPSMNYLAAVHGFYCFGCGKQGEVVDIFNLLNLMNIWTGHDGLKFIEQMKMAANLFVDQREEKVRVENLYSNGSYNDYHTDFIPYTPAMNKVRHNAGYLGMIPIEKDKKAIEYLESRKISLYTAKRLAVMTQYPTNKNTGESLGRGYLVFINTNGSYVRRLFLEDRELSSKCSWPASKWWNKKGAEVGIFNGQVIDHCKHFGEVCYVCEGAIDALTLENYGYHAIALNGVENAEAFAAQVDKENLVKYICLADSDAAGQKMARAFQEKGIYVPEFLLEPDATHILCQYKDINAAFVADALATGKALDDIMEKATKFYGF